MYNIIKLSSMGKEQKKLLKKSMTKKAYRDYCQRYRCTLTLGRNLGTRRMISPKYSGRKQKRMEVEAAAIEE